MSVKEDNGKKAAENTAFSLTLQSAQGVCLLETETNNGVINKKLILQSFN